MWKIKNCIDRLTVKLCDIALSMRECAEDQSEINEIVALRNKAQRSIDIRTFHSITNPHDC